MAQRKLTERSLATRLHNYKMTLTSVDTDPESRVQELYDQFICEHFNLAPEKLRRVKRTDGYIEAGDVVAILEYKFNLDLRDVKIRSQVIAQTLAYYRNLSDDKSGNVKIPNVVFVGDVDECFCFPTGILNKYLNDSSIIWNDPVSGRKLSATRFAAQQDVIDLLAADVDLQKECYIADVTVEGAVTDMLERMKMLALNKYDPIPITPENVMRAFTKFDEAILSCDITSNEKVGLFIDALRNSTSMGDAYFKMKGYPEFKRRVKVDDLKMMQLFAKFGAPSKVRVNDNALSDDEVIVATADKLIKDCDRRRAGAFFTPEFWVRKAHDYVADILGKGWEADSNNIVWDCCCGTKNLTRDYNFGNLYLSTLEQSELDMSSDLSEEAKETFQFDFLNEPIEALRKKAPKLYDELDNLRKHPERKLVFFVNPPYASAGDISGNGVASSIKKGCAETVVVANEMQKVGMNARELIVQFLYRMGSLVDKFGLKDNQLIIATFNKPTWMMGVGSSVFLNWFTSKMAYDKGFLFQASEFGDVSGAWGISFCIWHNDKKAGMNRGEFPHDLIENDRSDAGKMIGVKTFINSSKMNMMDDWWIDPDAKLSNINYAVDCKTLKVEAKSSKWKEDSYGNMGSSGNIAQNKWSFITTSPIPVRNGGHPITSNNFTKACIAFCCRNLISGNWVNDKDNYLAPLPEVESSLEFQNWATDCMIYAMNSYQTSIKGEVDGEAYDYHNAFFPFTYYEYVKEIKGSQPKRFDLDQTPYLRTLIASRKLSSAAVEVIERYKSLLKAVEPFRMQNMRIHPELQLDRWDAGIRQIRDLAKEHCKVEWDELKEAFKKLGNKIRPYIYDGPIPESMNPEYGTKGFSFLKN